MKLLLIRHGEPFYDEVVKRGYPFFGYDLGKLTLKGVKQATEVSYDKRLKGAELIISSPYTRALQTAAIISRITGIELTVENDIHEWIPDLDYSFKDASGAFDDYYKHQGKETDQKIINWETYEALKTRVYNALKPYVGKYEKVIVVCHGLVMSTFTHFYDGFKHCEILEVEMT